MLAWVNVPRIGIQCSQNMDSISHTSLYYIFWYCPPIERKKNTRKAFKILNLLLSWRQCRFRLVCSLTLNFLSSCKLQSTKPFLASFETLNQPKQTHTTLCSLGSADPNKKLHQKNSNSSAQQFHCNGWREVWYFILKRYLSQVGQVIIAMGKSIHKKHV